MTKASRKAAPAAKKSDSAKKSDAAEKAPPVAKLDAAALGAWPLPELDGKLGKESRGAVLVIGGSDEVPGAVVLAGLAALRAGAGKLQVATSKRAALPVALALPEARVIGLRAGKKGELAKGSCRAVYPEAERANAILVGPGMTDASAAMGLVAHCLGVGDKTLVVDAASIDTVRKLRCHDASVVITPHAGEMASLCEVERDEVLARPLDFARDVAARLGVVVALKGERTFIVAPDGRAFENDHGNLGLGTSGSGDVLSGIIAGLVARGADAFQATVWGVFVHARAGERLAKRIAPTGYLARELLDEIPDIVARPSGR